MFNDAFISYARVDLPRVEKLVEAIQTHDVNVWMDKEGIDGASIWRAEIVKAIKQSKTVIVFISKASVVSDPISRELTIACEESKPIIPVILEKVDFPPEVRFQLTGLQFINANENPEDVVDRILKAIGKHGQVSANRTGRRTSAIWRRPLLAVILSLLAIAVCGVCAYLFWGPVTQRTTPPSKAPPPLNAEQESNVERSLQLLHVTEGVDENEFPIYSFTVHNSGDKPLILSGISVSIFHHRRVGGGGSKTRILHPLAVWDFTIPTNEHKGWEEVSGGWRLTMDSPTPNAVFVNTEDAVAISIRINSGQDSYTLDGNPGDPVVPRGIYDFQFQFRSNEEVTEWSRVIEWRGAKSQMIFSKERLNEKSSFLRDATYNDGDVQ